MQILPASELTGVWLEIFNAIEETNKHVEVVTRNLFGSIFPVAV